MNLGQLVRSKMKELKADQSGEYIDKMGRHFELSADGDGYTVKYGGDKKLNVATEQACKLTAHCRKLESAERKELGQDTWTQKGHYFEKYYKQDYYGKVTAVSGSTQYEWDLMDETMNTVASRKEASADQAKAACDQAAARRR